MKLNQLLEGQIKTEHATLEYGWKRDLRDEEDDNYLPAGYSYDKVLELKMVKVKGLTKQGKGYGKEIFQKFLQSADAKKAELIFLDVNPSEGVVVPKGDEAEEEVMDKLVQVYRGWGFRNRPGSYRMWLVQNGEIPDNELPT